MSKWRDVIIGKFKNQDCSFLFVQDFDLLLNDEHILNSLPYQGYEVLRYEDSISFRFLYELKFREQEGKFKILLIANEDIFLPYEFEKKALKIKLDIHSLYPKFSAIVIRQISSEEFDELDRLHSLYSGPSSAQETLSFLIRNLYKIPYDIIDREVELYKALLSIHYKDQEVPNVVQNFLYDEWSKIDIFRQLPLKKMIRSSSFFYKYIEQQWSDLVKEYSKIKNGQICDSSTVIYNSPLADGDVRRMMSDLFMEGIIKKVEHVETSLFPDWMRTGIEEKGEEDGDKKLSYLFDEIEAKLLDAKRYTDWINIIEYLSEYKHTSIRVGRDTEQLFKKVNQSFQEWIVKYYHSLTSLPPSPKPKFVHHIPYVINKEKSKNEKVALLVLDGMSFPDWMLVRNHLKEKGFSFTENGVFAWVPTLTSVSRQAIFSGKMPLTFSKHISTTSAEEKWWKAFWEDQGILKQYVTYQKGLGVETYDSSKIKGLSRKATKVYGAVIDIIDQFIHHSVLGEKGVYTNLNLWLDSDYLENFLLDLQSAGFTIYITSDHGNTSASGVGRIQEGVLVDQTGERVRIYDDYTIYKNSATNIPSLKWPNIGLPEDFHVLLAPYGKAYVPEDSKVLSHGGISIEEVLVPFVKVEPIKGSGLN
ncbi:BREX-3 system phosphatase PglZ [Evansella clarkii]|uniref:BREX-3 system phosphatase PglZ n=1 Tax=Evansella clarkii TaxID=79879 RepID=UPI0009964CB0|nr:BREX-3 system phosphatase PglZ [Evansella clarkii]